MKKTIIASAVTALLATSALPAIAASSSLDLNANAGTALDSEVLTAQSDVGVDASLDASEDGVNVDAGADAGADLDAADSLDANADASADANAGAETGDALADDSFASAIASVEGVAALDLSAIAEDADIRIVLLSSLTGDAETEGAALDEALIASADAQAGLHARISENAAITAELEAEGYAVEDVVSLKTKADGSVIVYVDDRS